MACLRAWCTSLRFAVKGEMRGFLGFARNDSWRVVAVVALVAGEAGAWCVSLRGREVVVEISPKWAMVAEGEWPHIFVSRYKSWSSRCEMRRQRFAAYEGDGTDAGTTVGSGVCCCDRVGGRVCFAGLRRHADGGGSEWRIDGDVFLEPRSGHDTNASAHT